MKFLPSVKSVKAITLATVTAATTIASSIAPSQASQPTLVISTPGQPQVVMFDRDLKSLAIGCMPLRQFWRGVEASMMMQYGKGRNKSSIVILVQL